MKILVSQMISGKSVRAYTIQEGDGAHTYVYEPCPLCNEYPLKLAFRGAHLLPIWRQVFRAQTSMVICGRCKSDIGYIGTGGVEFLEGE